MKTPELMTLQDFLEHYRVGKTTFYKEVAAGRLRMLKVGRATKIAKVDAEDWLARLRSNCTAAGSWDVSPENKN